MITSCTPGTHLTHLTSFFIGLNQPSTKKALFKHNKGHLGSSEPSLWTPWTCIILTLYRWKISIKIRYSACINPTMETSLVVLKCVCVWKKTTSGSCWKEKTCTTWDVWNPYEWWDKLPINWCRIPSFNSMSWFKRYPWPKTTSHSTFSFPLGFWPMFVGFLHLYSAQTLDGLKANHPL